MGGRNQQSVLLTLGRLPVGLDIARSFSQAGWRVVVADPWRMHLLRSSNAVDRYIRVPAPHRGDEAYLSALTAILAEEHIDLVVPVSEETAWVSGLVTDTRVFCVPRAQWLELHDKLSFIRKAEALGLDVPLTWAGTEPPADNIALVSKPRLSCSGRGVRFHRPGDTPERDDRILVQEQLKGQAVCEFAIAHNGRVLCSSRYLPALVDGSVSIVSEQTNAFESCGNWTQTFVEGTSYTGFIAFDFIVSDDGTARAIECNPRATTGIHFIPAADICAAVLGQAPDSKDMRPGLIAEHYSCFTRWLASLRSAEQRQRIGALMRQADDIVYSRDDPWPFLLMMINCSGLIGRVLFAGHSFASAAVADVEWRHPDE